MSAPTGRLALPKRALIPIESAILACLAEPGTRWHLSEAVAASCDLRLAAAVGTLAELRRRGLVIDNRGPGGQRRRAWSITTTGAMALEAA